MITLRKARPEDQELLEYWDKQPHVIASDPEDDWDWEKELKRAPSWREQLIAQLDDSPIGMIQIIDPKEEESGYWGALGENTRAIDIWIGEEKNLSQGYGTTMMKMAISQCFGQPGVTKILVDPLKTNTRAHTFYKRIGFRFVEERVLGTSTCLIFELIKQ